MINNCFFFQVKIVEDLFGYEVVQVLCGVFYVLAVINEYEVFFWGRGDNGKQIKGRLKVKYERNITYKIFDMCLVKYYFNVKLFQFV